MADLRTPGIMDNYRHTTTAAPATPAAGGNEREEQLLRRIAALEIELDEVAAFLVEKAWTLAATELRTEAIRLLGEEEYLRRHLAITTDLDEDDIETIRHILERRKEENL